MKKAGRKKPGPKKGWKKRLGAAKRVAKTKRVSNGSWSWNRWYREADKHQNGMLVDIGRGKAIRIQAVKIS